jgi:ketosteroid isomerase-like protein
MRAWLAMKLVTRNMAALRDGDYRPTLQLDTDDICLHFPGRNSWAGDISGKDALGLWLARFARVGLQIYPDDVMVKGWPWRMTLAVRGHVHLHGTDGSLVYDNRYVIWGSMRWGRLAEYEVYEDTQKSAELDEYLAIHEPAA